MALGPWNQPPNFLGAMQAGASAGLQLRGQDIGSREAADRLSLAYNQLAAEEDARSEAARQRMEMAREASQQRAAIAAASNVLREKQINMLDQWHQAQIKQEQAKLGKPLIHAGTEGEVFSTDPVTGKVTVLREAREKGITPYQQAQLELSKQRFGLSKQRANRPSPFDLQSHASLLSEENALRKSLATGGILMDEDTRLKTLNRIGQIHKQRSALEAKYAQPDLTESAPGAAPEPATGTVPRVKVKGPGGVSGTVPQGSTLPEGWSLFEEPASDETSQSADEED